MVLDTIIIDTKFGRSTQSGCGEIEEKVEKSNRTADKQENFEQMLCHRHKWSRHNLYWMLLPWWRAIWRYIVCLFSVVGFHKRSEKRQKKAAQKSLTSAVQWRRHDVGKVTSRRRRRWRGLSAVQRAGQNSKKPWCYIDLKFSCKKKIFYSGIVQLRLNLFLFVLKGNMSYQ